MIGEGAQANAPLQNVHLSLNKSIPLVCRRQNSSGDHKSLRWGIGSKGSENAQAMVKIPD